MLRLQFSSRELNRNTAQDKHRRTNPQNFRNRERPPVISRRGPNDVSAGERCKEHHDTGNRDPNADAIARGRETKIVRFMAAAIAAAILAETIASATAPAADRGIDNSI